MIFFNIKTKFKFNNDSPPKSREPIIDLNNYFDSDGFFSKKQTSRSICNLFGSSPIDIYNMRFQEIIDSGSQGIVLKVTINKKIYALKIVQTAIDHSMNVFQEINVFKQFEKSDNFDVCKMVKIWTNPYNLLRNREPIYYLMEYMEGIDLDGYFLNHISNGNEVIDICIQIVESVRKMHKNGVIHCDIKEKNIFVQKNKKIKLIDFNLSHLADEIGKTIAFCRFSSTNLYVDYYFDWMDVYTIFKKFDIFNENKKILKLLLELVWRSYWKKNIELVYEDIINELKLMVC